MYEKAIDIVNASQLVKQIQGEALLGDGQSTEDAVASLRSALATAREEGRQEGRTMAVGITQDVACYFLDINLGKAKYDYNELRRIIERNISPWGELLIRLRSALVAARHLVITHHELIDSGSLCPKCITAENDEILNTMAKVIQDSQEFSTETEEGI